MINVSKNNVILGISFIAIVATSITLTLITHNSYRFQEEGVVEATSSAFESLATPEPASPKKLIIARVKINADIVPVAQTDDKVMETPKNWADTGWYIGNDGYPGQEGNLIINGHHDDTRGNPAAFWQLKNIVPNDKVLVIDEFGRPFTYTVIDKYYVGIASPDRFEKVYDYVKGQKLLTLITCGGVWVPNESTYDKRLIVRAQLSD